MKRKRKTAAICLIALAVLVAMLPPIRMYYARFFLQNGPAVENAANNTYQKTLRVMADYDYMPYAYYDENHAYTGHDVEMINEIANRLGMNLELRFTTWDSALRSVKNNDADVVMACEAVASDKFNDRLILTIPTAHDSFVAFGKEEIRNISELYDKKLSVVVKSSEEDILKSYGLADCCVEYQSVSEAMRAVIHGTCDYCVTRYTIGTVLCQTLGAPDVKGWIRIAESNMCLGVNIAEPALAEEINAVIVDMMQDATLPALEQKWVQSYTQPKTFLLYLRENPWLIVLYVLLLLLVSIILYASIRGWHNQEKVARDKKRLEEQVQARTFELNQKNKALAQINESIIDLLGNMVEGRDENSGEHIRRVKRYTNILAMQVMADLPEYGLTPKTVNLMVSAAALHDVGKITIPDAILLKPGKLTEKEFEIMKSHCKRGVAILDQVPMEWSREYLEMSKEICLNHHEKWDGNGYPAGLKEDEIPISAQIVSIADCFDALTTKRPYKDAVEPETAFDMLLTGACGTFSEKLLASLQKCRTAFLVSADEFRNAGLAAYEELKESRRILADAAVLLVDSKDSTRKVNSEALTEGHAIVKEAKNEEDALAAIADSEPFDAILIDISRSDLDSVSLIRKIRANEQASGDHVPLFVLTARRSKAQIEEYLTAGADGRLVKPLVLTDLAAALQKSKSK